MRHLLGEHHGSHDASFLTLFVCGRLARIDRREPVCAVLEEDSALLVPVYLPVRMRSSLSVTSIVRAFHSDGMTVYGWLG